MNLRPASWLQDWRRYYGTAHYWWPPLLVLIVYYPVLGNGFVWDDHKAFFLYPYYTDLKYLWRSFTEPLVFSPDYYRPLTSSTFILQHHFLGPSPGALHFGSLVIHASNTVLVSLIVRRLVDHWQQQESVGVLSLACGSIYALHPALIESVAWISVRYDLLVTLFMLLALVFDRSLHHKVWRPLVVGLLFFLAALSKEMALALAVGMPFWHLASEGVKSRNPREIIAGMRSRGDLSVYASIFIAGLLYLALRQQALGHLVGHQAPGWNGSRILLVFHTYYEYWAIMLFPFFNISPVHVIDLPLRVAVVANWWPVLVVTLFTAGAVYLVPRRPHFAWMAMFFLASLLPVSNIVPLKRPESSFFADSYLVYPVAAMVILFAVLCAEFLCAHKERKYLAIGSVRIALLLWLLASLVIVRSTLPLWNNDLSLWLWASLKQPRSATAHVNLSSTYLEHGRFHDALKSAEVAVKLTPGDGLAWSAQGRAMAELGLLDPGIESVTRATELEPSDPRHWYHLAMVYMKKGEYGTARILLAEEALRRDPDYLSALINLAVACQQLGLDKEAETHFQRARNLATNQHAISFIERNLSSSSGHP